MRLLSVVVAGCVALACGASAASAQRGPSWSGLYLGVHAGGGWSENVGADGNFDSSGFVGGGHIGFNFPTSGVVLGLEADISYAGIEKTLNDGMSVTFGTTWLGSVRGRVGLPIDQALIYLTAGLGLGGQDLSASGYGESLKGDTTMTGWVFGGGAEFAFSSSMTGRIEALHYRFADQEIKFSGGTATFDTNITAVRAGLSFKLN